jgi:hypothetical protein
MALAVKEAHLHVIFPDRSHDKTRAGPAERARHRALHGTMFGTCAG